MCTDEGKICMSEHLCGQILEIIVRTDWPNIDVFGSEMESHMPGSSFYVHHKTYTKPSTFVKYVIKFADVTNPVHILSVSSSHNHNWQV